MCPLESSFKMMKILESQIEKKKKKKKKRERERDNIWVYILYTHWLDVELDLGICGLGNIFFFLSQ